MGVESASVDGRAGPRSHRSRLPGAWSRPPRHHAFFSSTLDDMPSANGHLPRACVIGAGSSGIAAIKALHERGIPFDCFEASDEVGGNWVFGNRNGMSAAYRDLFINVSRERMAYSDFPMPTSYPDFPHHTHIREYFNDYVDHFGLRPQITFQTARRARRPTGGRLPGRSRSTPARRAPMTRCSSPTATTGIRAGPNPPSPARTRSPASSCTRTPTSTTPSSRAGTSWSSAWATRRWTSPSSPPTSPPTPTSPRATAPGSSPSTCSANRSTSCPTTRASPSSIRQRMIHQVIKPYTGNPERYGLPKPDHKFGEAHPTVSGRILDRIAHGTITPKPNIAALEGRAGALHRRQHRRRRRRRLLHRLQDHLPVLRPRPRVRARQPHRAVPARLPPRHPRPLLHRPAAAARRDHAARRGPGRVGRRPPARRLRAAAPGARCAPTSPPIKPRCASATSPPSATRSRSTSTTTSTPSPSSAAPAPSAPGLACCRRSAASGRAPTAFYADSVSHAHLLPS